MSDIIRLSRTVRTECSHGQEPSEPFDELADSMTEATVDLISVALGARQIHSNTRFCAAPIITLWVMRHNGIQ